jgi:hypothetical protein
MVAPLTLIKIITGVDGEKGKIRGKDCQDWILLGRTADSTAE